MEQFPELSGRGLGSIGDKGGGGGSVEGFGSRFDSIEEDDDEDQESSTDNQSFINKLGEQYNEKEKEETVIAEKETQDVLRLRLIVFCVLLVSAVTVGSSVYSYVSHSEYTKFQNQFKQSVHKVLESIGTKVESTFAALDVLATSIVSHASSTNQTWPNVTIADFAVRAAKTRSVSLGIFIETANVVQYEQRMGWEEYGWEHKDWINASLEIQKTDENYYGPTIWNTTADRSIYGDYGPIPYDEK
jgi:hypothetical protein